MLSLLSVTVMVNHLRCVLLISLSILFVESFIQGSAEKSAMSLNTLGWFSRAKKIAVVSRVINSTD